MFNRRSLEQRSSVHETSGVDQYKVEDVVLGRGTFGTVKLARHRQTGEKFAFKMVDKQAADWKLMREIELHRSIEHPHVVRLHEMFDRSDAIYMLLELVPNGDLFDYIVRQSRLPESDARRVFQQIISGIDHCHVNMIVHRDIKPENILMSTGYNVKIADFGFAARMKPGEHLKTSCGSPNYAAPELFYRGCTYRGPEVDIWSCGVVLYAMLCGELPFDEPGLPELIRKIKLGSYKIPGCVYGGAKDMIQHILNVDPSLRASMSEIWAHPWFTERLPTGLRTIAAQTPSTTEAGASPANSESFDLQHSEREDVDPAGQTNEEHLRDVSEPHRAAITKQPREEPQQADQSPSIDNVQPRNEQACATAPLLRASTIARRSRTVPARSCHRRAASSAAKLCSTRSRRRPLAGRSHSGSGVKCNSHTLLPKVV